MLRIRLFLFALACCHTLYASTENDSLFSKGNAAYAAGNFSMAYRYYDGLLRDGVEDASLYFNFGNTCIQMNQPAKAIAYYEKSLRLNPNDKASRENLRETRKVLGLDYKDGGWVMYSFLQKTHLTGLIALVGIWIALAALFRWLFTTPGLRQSRLLYVALFFALFAALFCYFTIDSWNKSRPNHYAIIIENETVVKESPAINGLELFELKPGTKVQILQLNNGWCEVNGGKNRRGWIPASTLISI